MLKLFCLIFVASISFQVFSQNIDSVFTDKMISQKDSLNAVVPDSVDVSDTLKTNMYSAKDTVVPIQGEPLSDAGTIISRRAFLFENYRYTGDLLRSFSFNFIKDLGFIGQPNETFIYGAGNNGVSYLLDGVLWNNRYTNSLDLNFVQSEDIDSIEIVPSPRGFLYGPYNNPVTINFITRDFISPEPYTRIKYYEGPDGEAMIDGKFNAKIMNRWNLSFQAANRKVDETYTNSEFSIWQANAKLKYFLSNSINLMGSYYFVSSSQGLNGGVDYDSLLQISDKPDSDLYEPLIAPVLYPNRTLDATQNNFGLRTLASVLDNSRWELAFYYKYCLDKFDKGPVTLYDDLETRTFGGSLFYNHKESEFLELRFGLNYDENNSKETKKDNPSSSKEYSYNYFSASGLLLVNLLDKVIQPSVYYKYENIYWQRISITEEYIEGNSGFGVDLKIQPSDYFSFYTGYSRITQFDATDAESFEVSGKFKIEDFSADLKFFDRSNFIPYTIWVPWWTSYEVGYLARNVKGTGMKLDYKVWLILFESDFSYYFDMGTEEYTGLPETRFKGAIYVNDTFFEENLELKTGFEFYHTGKSGSFVYKVGFIDVEPTYKLDFTLAGEIKKVAVFYFIWENLLDNQYYITPYYPMPERNIRFGLAWELFN